MKVPREDYIDGRYRKLMEDKKGKKLVDLLIVLTDCVLTVDEIRNKLDWKSRSRSTTTNYLKIAEKEGYVNRFKQLGSISRPRGKTKFKENKTGRPFVYYSLTSEGLWLIRLDPRVRNYWKQIENLYSNVDYVPTFLDSYANVVQALNEDFLLKETDESYYFMDQELQCTILNPFVWFHEADEKEVMQKQDQLVNIIKKNVKPEYYSNYYKTLESSVSRLKKIIQRHEILIEKLKAAETA